VSPLIAALEHDILPPTKTTVSAELRKQDGIQAGQELEIERLGRSTA
jgi:hypothetical protein